MYLYSLTLYLLIINHVFICTCMIVDESHESSSKRNKKICYMQVSICLQERNFRPSWFSRNDLIPGRNVSMNSLLTWNYCFRLRTNESSRMSIWLRYTGINQGTWNGSGTQTYQRLGDEDCCIIVDIVLSLFLVLFMYVYIYTNDISWNIKSSFLTCLIFSLD